MAGWIANGIPRGSFGQSYIEMGEGGRSKVIDRTNPQTAIGKKHNL
jgi:hypothetical protein